MSLGKDLASIRKSKNLTLEDIQNAIKIPLDTLKSIEDESIFDQGGASDTYARSFVRSYAKVLKIDDEDAVKALDELEAGHYSGNLLIDYQTEDSGTASSFTEDMDTEESQLDTSEALDIEEEPTTESESAGKPIDPPVLKTDEKSEKKKPVTTESDVDSINWADMGRRFTTVSRKPRVWIFAALFVLVCALGATAYIFWDDITGNAADSPESTEPIVEETDPNVIPPAIVDSADTTGVQEMEESMESETQEPTATPITLGDTLRVTVYAAYGQLEPVRVTSDLNGRTNPFWMEQGEAYYFDFNDTLLVRGQYSRMLLLFNGHVIENPRQNYFNPVFNSIMLTRDVLNQPRYLAPAPEEFPLSVGAPDSTVYRIRF